MICFFKYYEENDGHNSFLKYYGLFNSPAIQPPHAVIKNPLKCLIIKKNKLVRIMLADQKSLSLLCPLTAHSKPYAHAKPYHHFLPMDVYIAQSKDFMPSVRFLLQSF